MVHRVQAKSIKDLEGFCYRNDNKFNNPHRRAARNHLYTLLESELKSKRGMLQYDKFTVLRLLENKVKEGNL
jgi:hypothetical protein